MESVCLLVRPLYSHLPAQGNDGEGMRARVSAGRDSEAISPCLPFHYLSSSSHPRSAPSPSPFPRPLPFSPSLLLPIPPPPPYT